MPSPLPMPSRWSPGRAFRFSGFDGPTDWDCPYWATAGRRPIELVTATSPPVRISIDIGRRNPATVLGDVIRTTGDPPVVVLFENQHAIAGFLPPDATLSVAVGDGGPSLPGDRPLPLGPAPGVRQGAIREDVARFHTARADGGTRWVLAFNRSDADRTPDPVARALAADPIAGADLRIDTVARLARPFAVDSDAHTRAAIDAFSVLRGACYAPQDRFADRWCAPSPRHVHLNVWDTLFHGFGTRFIDPAMPGREARMLLESQRDDGFIGNPQYPPSPHHDARGIHPPLIGWALDHADRRLPDHDLLEYAYPRLCAFVEWVCSARDRNRNGIPEWREADGCESGRDNDPRWDNGQPFDAVDFAGFLGSEYLHLAAIARRIGRGDDARRWDDRHAALRVAVNDLMWHGNDRFYYDHRVSGGSIRIRTNAAFVLLFGGLVPPDRAAEIVQRHLLDPASFWTEFPVPTVARDDPAYEPDMWRGPTWLCVNHLIVNGLLRYGFDDIAHALARRTVDAVARNHERTGLLWEFYDPDDRTPPASLDRKGYLRGGGVPDIGGNVADYSWTASTYLHFLDLLTNAAPTEDASRGGARRR